MGGVASYLCIVIGAGQAGLATAQQLAHHGLVPGEDFLLIDANPGPGGAWRHRWDSLTLGKAHSIANLPGMKTPKGDDSTPASQVVAEYYGAYEDQFHLRPYRPARVRRVTQDGDFHVMLDSGEVLVARTIVNATGTWDRPYIPLYPGNFLIWRPAAAHEGLFPAGTHITVDVIFWNTGFRPVLDHLAPLRLRSRHGGIALRNEVAPLANPRVFLAGYGSTASTVGTTRAGRLAAREVIAALDL